MSALEFHPLASLFPLVEGQKTVGGREGAASRGRPVVALAKPCHSSK
jgi:hypothetical protein